MNAPANPPARDDDQAAAHSPHSDGSPADDVEPRLLSDEEAAPRTAIQRLWYRLLRLLGWDITGYYPRSRKYVLVVAPHTSNWDFFIGFIVSRSVELGFPYWLGKDSLFRQPLGAIFRRLGGIPVDRSESHRYVEAVADEFARQPDFILGITPEGTRRRTEYWKSGFYYIALRAGVPIVLGYLDYARKLAGLGPIFMPSGDIEADFRLIREFYGGIRGKYPDKQGEVRIRPRTSG